MFLKQPLKLGLGILPQKKRIYSRYGHLNSEQAYQKTINDLKQQYLRAIKNAKECYEEEIKNAKNLLKERKIKERSGSDINETTKAWKNSRIGPKPQQGMKLAPTARLDSKNSKRINKERYT